VQKLRILKYLTRLRYLYFLSLEFFILPRIGRVSELITVTLTAQDAKKGQYTNSNQNELITKKVMGNFE
jgi:hypothetical protein